MRCDLIAVIARANWDYSGQVSVKRVFKNSCLKNDTNIYSQSMLFHYVTRSRYIATAGKSLAGWTDPAQKVCPPRIEAFLSELNMEAYECFALGLFRRTGLTELHAPSRLLKFRDQMIANFLMHMESMQEDLGSNDPVLNHVIKSAGEAGISKAQLLNWGGLIKNRFACENASQQIDNSTNPGIIAALQQLTATVANNAAAERAHRFQQDARIDSMVKNHEL